MIICSCNVVSDHEIPNVVTAAREQPLRAEKVYGCLGCTIRCGRCARAIKRIMSEALAVYDAGADPSCRRAGKAEANH
jgi:bacterioferritin-associated ferredoxin